MPKLFESISDYEEDLLLAIAEQWGLDDLKFRARQRAKQITEKIIEGDRIASFLESLPDSELEPLREIARQGGRMAWLQFERKFGKLREMGAARRKRERPDQHPASTTESVFYKGLVGKAFFDDRGGPQEFAFIPDEILSLFTPEDQSGLFESVRSLTLRQVRKKWLANDYIVDHASTGLAALRIGMPFDQLVFTKPDVPPEFLKQLLEETGLITPKKEIITSAVKTFLEAPRPDAMTQLFNIWKKSRRINELNLLTHVEFEKDPKNDALLPRSLLLDIIGALPDESWFAVSDLIQVLFDTKPDILRKGGEYDTWLIKDPSTGNYLSGFDNWQAVEGQYLEAMVKGPLNWFGLLDAGKTTGKTSHACFRKSQWAQNLLEGSPLQYKSITEGEFDLEKSGGITAGRYFPRHIRYQLSRFCDWGAQKGSRYEYRITPVSLKRAAGQDLTIRQLLSILKKHARKPIPANILRALQRWEKFTLEVDISQAVVIKVHTADILDQLMASTARQYIHERLNSESALADSRGIAFIHAKLLELGYFSQVDNFNEKQAKV